MKQIFGKVIAGSVATAFLVSAPLVAQTARGDWAMNGNDPGQSGWQKAETKLSPESVPSSFKFLWKIQLGKPAEVGDAFTEPLLAARLINSHGFKDFVYWTSSDTLYGVDSELGTLLWQKKFDRSRGAASGCSSPSLSTAMEPPVVINFNARRAPGTPPPRQAGPLAENARRLGVPAGGGGFGLKGIYVLTKDGMLHEQVLTTGADYGPAVKFLTPDASGSVSGLTIHGKTLYAASGHDCKGVANGLWSINVSQAEYPVSSYPLQKIDALGLSGPAVAPDGTAYILTGPGGAAGTNIYPNSVVALGSDMKPRDWYTPSKTNTSISSVTPVTFAYKGKQYVVAPAGDGSIVLLDAASLGGADHHTPLAQTPSFSSAGSKHAWDGFATYLDKSGAAWIYASISAPIVSHQSSATTSGSTPHGGIVAFRIDDADQKPILTPVWISRDLINPAPPALANGILVALSEGDRATHANLYVLDATTGKELFTSGDTIPTYSHLSGVSLGDGHAFFTDHTGTLYSFGIGLEH